MEGGSSRQQCLPRAGRVQGGEGQVFRHQHIPPLHHFCQNFQLGTEQDLDILQEFLNLGVLWGDPECIDFLEKN